MTSSVINSDDGLVSGVPGLQTSGGNDGNIEFQSNGTTVAALTDGAFSVAGDNISATNSLGFRNRIINGDMRIDQRNAGASGTISTAQTFFLDRFSAEKTNLSTLVATVQQVSDAPAGFTNSLKVTVTTAEASGSSSSFVGADQRIEGFNFADMGFGTASASSFTMSFWVKSSVTGTYPVSFFNASVNRAYLATYTISAANTWEHKTITVAGDTTGTWNTTNGIGLGFQFSLGAGTNSDGTAGSWSSTYKARTSACVNLNATLNATWQITGVQLEAGSVATPFERRPYGTELALCQRYFQAYQATSYRRYCSNVDRTPYSLPVPMRAIATTNITAASGTGINATSIYMQSLNSVTIDIQYTSGGTGVVDYYSLGYTLSAEL